MAERELPPPIAGAVGFFNARLDDPRIPDRVVRNDFYTLSHGVIPGLEEALLECLEEKRPEVARTIWGELENAK